MAGVGIGVILAIGGISVASIINNNKQKAKVVENTRVVESNNNENIVASSKTSKQANKQQNNEAILVAEKFINDYIDENISLEDWLATQPITERFRKELIERQKALKLVDALLAGNIKESELSKADKGILDKYQGIEYDFMLGGMVLDLYEQSKFKVKSWNEKTGIAVLYDTVPSDIALNGSVEELKLKLVKSSGKWLVDGVTSK